jgi:hypothetical protein
MRSPFVSRIVPSAALLIALSSADLARAQKDTSTAEHLFSEGLAALKREDWKAACEAFGGSNEADASPGTQINLGVCNEKQGKLATAWGWYRTAAGLADQRGQRERAEGARNDAARIEKNLRKLVITLKEPLPGIAVQRDGAAVPTAIVGKEVPVDPGEHTIEVTAKGKRPWSTKVNLAPGPGIDRIEVPPLENAPEDKGGGNPGDPGYIPPVIQTSDGSGQRTTGLVVGGAGILALLAAGGVYILARNEAAKGKELRDRAANEPANRATLDETAKTRFDAADNNQLIAIVCAAGGTVLLGVGAYLFFSAPKRSSGSLQLAPVAGAGTTGLSLSGAF